MMPISWPPAFGKERDFIERAINRPRRFRSVTTRYDKRGYVFPRTSAVLLIQLRS